VLFSRQLPAATPFQCLRGYVVATIISDRSIRAETFAAMLSPGDMTSIAITGAKPCLSTIGKTKDL